jgi:hypothetical protein
LMASSSVYKLVSAKLDPSPCLIVNVGALPQASRLA